MRALLAALALAFVTGCAARVVCGPGTTLQDGQCVAPVLTCAPGLVLEAGECRLPSTTETCTPDCTGRTCGGDGCGGSCGTCQAGEFCGPAGTCLPQETCVPDCKDKDCGADGCGGVCGVCDDPQFPLCVKDRCAKECIPDCMDGKACGSDGCGGTCGACEAGSTCDARQRCVPDGWTCDRSRYGDQRACDCGCGVPDSDCAEHLPAAGCRAGEFCNARSTCESGVPAGWTCAKERYGEGLACDCGCGVPDPDCARAVPVNGCGFGETCAANGTCAACVPRCDGRDCGPDGCGGTCGPGCHDPARPVCHDGQCANPCTPAALLCETNECGDDACGGSCGTCLAGLRCEGGQCVEDLGDPSASCRLRCGDFAPSGCSCAQGCEAAGNCCPDFTLRCACTPSCDGRTCGDDGCGGSCGSCTGSTPFCTPSGTCSASCTPSCHGRTCGPDGCGGTCGTCANGSSCAFDGRCVPDAWTCAPYDYDEGLGCECGCGVRDPDCDRPNLPVAGCPAQVACGATGYCDITPCHRDGECSAGRWCLGAYRTAGGGFAGQCGVPTAFAEAPGTACEVDDECATRVCLGGQCRRHCTADADCAGGQKCLGMPVSAASGRLFEGMIGVCDRPAGSLSACDRQSACGQFETCLPFVDPVTTGPRFLCGQPDPAAVQVGASCENASCAAGLFCVGRAGSRTCAKACPGGVTDCPSGWSCRDVTFHDHGTADTSDDPRVPVCLP